MSRIKTLGALALAISLTACGSAPEEPVEQIVVKEPGAADAPAAPTAIEPVDLVAAGEAAFAVCSACHSVAADGASGLGPNLYGVAGRAAGALPEYGYSEALAGSGVVWTEAELDAFIANPAAKVPGTSMSAGAVSDPERRAAIVAYLASLGG